jgi:hypothetical protein
MLGIGKIFLVIVYINTNSPKRDKDVLIMIHGNNGLFKFKILKKKKIEKLRSKNLEFFILMVLAESEPNS